MRSESWSWVPGPSSGRWPSRPSWLRCSRANRRGSAIGDREASSEPDLLGEGILAAALDAAVIADGDGRVLDLNRAAEALFGYSRDDARGELIADLFVPPPLVDAHRAGIVRLASGGEPRILGRRIETVGRRADGSEVPVELTVTQAAEAPLRYVAWIRDLTEFKRMERERDQERSLMAQAESVVGIGSFRWDVTTDEVVVSKNAERLVGIGPGDLDRGEDAFAVIHPDDHAKARWAREIVRDGGEFPEFEFRMATPGRETRRFRVHAETIDRRAGKPSLVVGVIDDITESRLAQFEIRAHVAVSDVIRDWQGFDASAPDLLSRLGTAMDWKVGAIWVPDGDALVCRAFWSTTARAEPFEEATRELRLWRGHGLPGKAWEAGAPVSIGRVGEDPDFRRREPAAKIGLEGAIGLPLLAGGDVLAVLEFYSAEPRELDERMAATLTGIGHELGDFLARRRAELGPPPLSPRELEVIRLAARGLAGPKIAEELFISPTTVKSHFENIYEKLGQSDRATAVAEAIRLGLID